MTHPRFFQDICSKNQQISYISKWSGTTFQSNTRFVHRLRIQQKHWHCNEPKITALPSVILEIYLLQNADSRIFGDKKRGEKKAFFFMTLTKCHIENDTVVCSLSLDSNLQSSIIARSTASVFLCHIILKPRLLYHGTLRCLFSRSRPGDRSTPIFLEKPVYQCQVPVPVPKEGEFF